MQHRRLWGLSSSRRRIRMRSYQLSTMAEATKEWKPRHSTDSTGSFVPCFVSAWTRNLSRTFQGNTHFKACKEISSTSRISAGGFFPTRKYLPYLPATRSPLGDGPRLGAGSKEIFKPSSPSSYRRSKNVKSQDVTRLPYVPWILVEWEKCEDFSFSKDFFDQLWGSSVAFPGRFDWFWHLPSREGSAG